MEYSSELKYTKLSSHWFWGGDKFGLEQNYATYTGLKFGRKSYVQTGKVRLMYDGTLFISAGYVWDGASGPTFSNQTSQEASIVHDALYGLLRKFKKDCPFTRKQADKIYRELLRQKGYSGFRAGTHYYALRLFGWMNA